MAYDRERNEVGCLRAFSENGTTDGEGEPYKHSVAIKMGQSYSPWPGGVRLTARARAAKTDCSASPRRRRPLRDLRREQQG